MPSRIRQKQKVTDLLDGRVSDTNKQNKTKTDRGKWGHGKEVGGGGRGGVRER